MKKPLFIKWSHAEDLRLVVKWSSLEMAKCVLLGFWNVGNLKTFIWSNAASSSSGGAQHFLTHCSDYIPLTWTPWCIWLMCFSLAIVNERFITIYFRKTSLFALQRARLERDQELFLNCKSAYMVWVMIDPGLLKKVLWIKKFLNKSFNDSVDINGEECLHFPTFLVIWSKYFCRKPC